MKNNFLVFLFAIAVFMACSSSENNENSESATLSSSGHNKTMAMNMIKDSANQYSEEEMMNVAKFFSEKVAYHISIPLFQKIISKYPNNTTAKLLLANNLRETQEYNTAISLYNELVTIDSIEFIVLPERARLYVALQEFDKAEVDIERARGLQPKYFAVFLADGLLTVFAGSTTGSIGSV